MGTKVHCKSYLPGYYSMRDLNEDASTGSWSPFYEDKMLKNGQYYNGFTPMALDGYSEYDKEALKQTMIHHEDEFRKQVRELHRLYKIQRDLMDELQKKELYKYSIPVETSLFNPFSSHMPSGDTQKLWQMPTMPVLNSTYSRPSFSFSGTEDRRSPLQFLKESNVQSDSSPIKNGVSVNDCEWLDSKAKKFKKRTFDLQLPADVYIESEDGEGIGKGKTSEMPFRPMYCQNKNYGVEPGSDGNLTLGTGEKPSCGDDKKMDSNLQSSHHTRCLADLNEPIQGICSEEASASASFIRLESVACHEDIQGKQLPVKQNLSILGLSKDFFQDNQKCRDDRSLSNLIHSEREECKQERLYFNLEAGRSRINPISSTSAFCHERLPVSSEQLQVDIKVAHELPQFYASDQSKRESWFRGKATCAELSKRNSGLIISNVIEQVASPIPSISCTDDANTASRSVSSWRRPADSITQVPFAALPCLNGSFSLNSQIKSSNSLFESPSITKEKWDLNVNLRSHPSPVTEFPRHNGFKYGFQSETNSSILQFPLTGIDKLNLNCGDCSSYEHSDVHVPGKISKGVHCTDVKSAKDMNLNLPNGFRDGINSEGDLVLIDGKNEDLLKGVSRLGTKPKGLTQKDLGFLRGCSRPLSSWEVESQSFHIKIEAEKGSSPGFKKDFSTTSHTKDAESHKIELADGPSSKIFGFPVLHSSPVVKDPCPYNSSMSCLNQSEIANTENGVTAGLHCVDTPSKPALLNLEKKPFIEDHVSENECDSRSSTVFRDHINLNSLAIASDEKPLESLEISFKNNREVPISSVPEAPAELTAEIDLEAPVLLPDLVKDIPTESENLGINQQVRPVQLMQCEIDDSQDTLARMAAEVIIDMSSRICSHLDDGSCHSSSSALRDSLLWFSEVVSLNAGVLESMVAALEGRGDADNESSDDGGDFFEAMTLKLTETKVEECSWMPWERENQKEEETGTATLLTRRKTQRRRGRQRRDFQKDILPGLVSLSRHEVTEDLQTFGGLMRASGCFWQTGMARRNAARNGWHCQARGRRRPRGSAAAGAGNWVCLLPRQSSNGEVELEGGVSLQGWGKTTRRCRRQRFPSGNASAALT